MLVLVIRCANGIVIWDKVSTGTTTANWVCQRDGFIIAAPKTATEANAFLVTLNQHSVSLAGNVVQVVELAL